MGCPHKKHFPKHIVTFYLIQKPRLGTANVAPVVPGSRAWQYCTGKGQESKLYEALYAVAGLFLIFTFVKMKGPNK